jgi:hypothetical protein
MVFITSSPEYSVLYEDVAARDFRKLTGVPQASDIVLTVKPPKEPPYLSGVAAARMREEEAAA